MLHTEDYLKIFLIDPLRIYSYGSVLFISGTCYFCCMKKFLLIFLFIPYLSQAQNSSQDITKNQSSYVFGQIYTGFYYGFKTSYTPRAAFVFNQGIIGYYHELSDKVSGKIMFDVTRTTNFDSIIDRAGNHLKYYYFEGSKYTAYLKMAEIKWDINEHFTFRVGQLLSTQYLTFIDKFWGFRYVDVTLQEKFRFGNPADFGVQFDYAFEDKLLNQFSVVNGEGPFRYQDANSKFIYSDNIQVYPTKHIILKLYADWGASPDTGSFKKPKSVISGFAGFQNEKVRLGVEYDFVNNYGYNKDDEYTGISLFGACAITDKVWFLLRFDHLDYKTRDQKDIMNYMIAGFQYEPVKNFTTSCNFRYYSQDALPFIYANFGLKF